MGQAWPRTFHNIEKISSPSERPDLRNREQARSYKAGATFYSRYPYRVTRHASRLKPPAPGEYQRVLFPAVARVIAPANADLVKAHAAIKRHGGMIGGPYFKQTRRLQ